MANNEINKLIRNILNDIRIDLSDEFDRNFERQAFFSEVWQRRKSPTRPGGSILVQSPSKIKPPADGRDADRKESAS